MGLRDTAHRVKFLLGEIFAYAIETARYDYNPVTAIGKRALKPADTKNYRCITNIEEARNFIKACLGYDNPVTRCAVLFSILTMSRPGTVRKAEWDEIDLENGLWVVPPEKMKMKRPHIASLPTQLIDMLKTLHLITGHQKWLFPNIKFNGEPMSDGTISKAFRKIGYGDKMVAHSVRGMGSTILREIGYPREHVETQLAHQIKDKVEAAYNHAEYTLKRKIMMQAYADRLFSDAG